MLPSITGDNGKKINSIEELGVESLTTLGLSGVSSVPKQHLRPWKYSVWNEQHLAVWAKKVFIYCMVPMWGHTQNTAPKSGQWTPYTAKRMLVAWKRQSKELDYKVGQQFEELAISRRTQTT